MAKYNLTIRHEVVGKERFPGLEEDIVVKTMANGKKVKYEPLGTHLGTIASNDLESFSTKKGIDRKGLEVVEGHNQAAYDVDSPDVFELGSGPHSFSVITLGNQKKFHVFSRFDERKKEDLRKLLNLRK